MATVAKDGDKFSGGVDRLEKLLTGLSGDRETIGAAIDSLDKGTASIADLLGDARRPLAGTVAQLDRLAPLLDSNKDLLQVALAKTPHNLKKLTRIASYGDFLNFYICAFTIRVTDLQGRTAVFPWIKQEGGRCADS
jgi:phospholipid/cholesterol/gamma-HCH transport system substrate-binding protein